MLACGASKVTGDKKQVVKIPAATARHIFPRHAARTNFSEGELEMLEKLSQRQFVSVQSLISFKNRQDKATSPATTAYQR